MIKQREVKKLFWKTMVCNSCGTEMVFTGNVTASSTPEYEYRCHKCMAVDFSYDCYPRMKAEFAEEDSWQSI